MKVEWTPEMAVGDEVIDSQHKKLLHQLNELKEELARGVDMSPIRGTIDFFEKYVMEHLSYEENYMQKHKYPNLNEHKKLHKNFIDYFKKFKEEFDASYRSEEFSSRTIKDLLSKAEKFLEEWWVNHILTKDHQYATYVRIHED